MKKIAFKTVTTQIGEESVIIDYKGQINALMLIPLNPEKGTNYEEMAKIMPILAKLDTESNYVLLEDAEHEEVVKRLKNGKFRQNTPEIFEMIQHVIDAPDHLIEAVKDG